MNQRYQLFIDKNIVCSVIFAMIYFSGVFFAITFTSQNIQYAEIISKLIKSRKYDWRKYERLHIYRKFWAMRRKPDICGNQHEVGITRIPFIYLNFMSFSRPRPSQRLSIQVFGTTEDDKGGRQKRHHRNCAGCTNFDKTSGRAWANHPAASAYFITSPLRMSVIYVISEINYLLLSYVLPTSSWCQKYFVICYSPFTLLEE